MSERYCPHCGAQNTSGAETCHACIRPLPGTDTHRRATSRKRKAALGSLVVGVILIAVGYLLEGGTQIVNTRRGPSTATSIKLQIILGGLAVAGYGTFTLYQSRGEA
jgi:hypothetical protein